MVAANNVTQELIVLNHLHFATDGWSLNVGRCGFKLELEQILTVQMLELGFA